jgi:AAA15 family ATPase/GTPase
MVMTMIISVSVENWMSFRNRATFSMVASRERQHGKRVPKISKYQTRILPVAAIYGGNASGKTNFCRALNFAKRLVVKGTQPDSRIPVKQFLMEAENALIPSRFTFELLIDDVVYEFSFAVTQKAVIEEKLVLITSTSEKVLYHRYNGKPNFNKPLAKKQFLQFAFNGTRDNQLFLTNSISQKIETFRPVYNWFKETLELISPDSRFGPFDLFMDEDHPLYATMNEILPQLDTGIIRIGGEEVSFENLTLPEDLEIRLQEEVTEGKSVHLVSEPKNERFVITRKGGELIVKKLITYHSKTDGSETKFEIHQESDGSQRVIDLLPVFLNLSDSTSKKVYIIDEIDRSLHTLLTRRLIDAYLSECSTETRNQLILTTHDLLLMDQQLLRRDEMWVTERESIGVSNLYSFSDYKDVRYDKDIRKSYLQGRLGGIPRILIGNTMSNGCFMQERDRKF